MDNYNHNILTWHELCAGFLWDEDSLDEFDDNFMGCKIYENIQIPSLFLWQYIHPKWYFIF